VYHPQAFGRAFLIKRTKTIDNKQQTTTAIVTHQYNSARGTKETFPSCTQYGTMNTRETKEKQAEGKPQT
jgi:hypothetical protein